MDVPPFAATRPEGASDSRSEAEISAAPATKASLCHGKSSAFSLPAVYSREAEWFSRFCMPAGVPRMQDFYTLRAARTGGAACQKILHSEGTGVSRKPTGVSRKPTGVSRRPTGVRVPSPPASAPHDSTHTPIRRRIGMHQNIHGAEKSRK